MPTYTRGHGFSAVAFFPFSSQALAPRNVFLSRIAVSPTGIVTPRIIAVTYCRCSPPPRVTQLVKALDLSVATVDLYPTPRVPVLSSLYRGFPCSVLLSSCPLLFFILVAVASYRTTPPFLLSGFSFQGQKGFQHARWAVVFQKLPIVGLHKWQQEEPETPSSSPQGKSKTPPWPTTLTYTNTTNTPPNM